MHKSPMISLSRKVSLDGMTMRSRSLAGMDAPPQHDYVAEMMSHGSLADLNQYGPGNVTPSSHVSPSSSPTFGVASSATTSASNSNDPGSYRGASSSSRKRQKDSTGLTFKGHARQFARHNYHDHANDDPGTSSVEQVSEIINVRGGVKTPFPLRLHTMLEAVEKEGLTDIVSWQPHGRAFAVHDIQRFVYQMMPRFFQQHKYSSFQRQLNLYGFMRLTRKGPDHGGYYHELFLRSKVFLCASIQRIRVKGTLIRTTSSPETEPDFYLMPSVEAASMSDTVSISGSSTTIVDSANIAQNVTPPVSPPHTLPTMFPALSKSEVEEIALVQTRRRLDQVLATVALQKPIQMQYQQPVVNGIAPPELTSFAEPFPRLEYSNFTPDESELAFFLDDFDFYSSDAEFLTEI